MWVWLLAGAAVARVRVRAEPVPVVGDRLDVVERVRVEVLAGLPQAPSQYNPFRNPRAAIQRRGDPRDIANALMFLASDAASFITGQTINVDGGMLT